MAYKPVALLPEVVAILFQADVRIQDMYHCIEPLIELRVTNSLKKL